jgi:hypothetical protein
MGLRVRGITERDALALHREASPDVNWVSWISVVVVPGDFFPSMGTFSRLMTILPSQLKSSC